MAISRDFSVCWLIFFNNMFVCLIQGFKNLSNPVISKS